MTRSFENFTGGISINGRMINNLRYAHDTTLITKNEAGMTILFDLVTNATRAPGLEIKLSETKLMIIERGSTIQLRNLQNRLEVVNIFIYWGSFITTNTNAKIKEG